MARLSDAAKAILHRPDMSTFRNLVVVPTINFWGALFAIAGLLSHHYRGVLIVLGLLALLNGYSYLVLRDAINRGIKFDREILDKEPEPESTISKP